MAQIRLSVRELVEFLLRSGSIDSRFTGFDRANEGARIHRKLQKAAGEGYQAEVFLAEERTVDGLSFRVEGRADGIFSNEDGTTVIDEIKTTTLPAEAIREDGNPCHWAQGMVYGAIYARQQSLPRLDVRLTYYQTDTGEIVRFTRHFTQEALDDFFSGLLRQYAPWAKRQQQWEARRTASLAALAFPFAEYRPGQRALAGEIYRACKAEEKGGTRLFCQAPTGIGKTMSALFPALKAMGEGKGSKLFYLTARNTTQAAAEDALARLRAASPGLALRSVTLTAKEKACLCKDAEGHPACLPELCPYANGYYDRWKDALSALLDAEDGSFGRAALTRVGQQFSVCPFELGLDLSEWCDVIIGDYNYLFDPVVKLRRFFDTAGDWLFLIDEAHNLPDRARAMYSASFSKTSLTEAKRALGPGKSALKTALRKADQAFLEARRAVARLAPRRKPLPAETSLPEAEQTSLLSAPDASPGFSLPDPLLAEEGTVFLQELPTGLLRPLQALNAPLQAWLEENPDGEAHATLLDLYFSVQDLLQAAERYDEHFVTQLTAHSSALEFAILCLDPAPFVDSSLRGGRAAALFSATLTPPGYYRNVLGCPDARAVALESPFPPQHLGLYCLPSISTRYRDREASIRPISDALAALTRGKTGNYLAFFPSYAYLRQVYEDFTARHPELPTVLQESGLDDAARAAFLARFVPHPEKTLLGFGVLGGIFGEGVDLVGDRLIGCAIVGVGLPQVNPRQEILRRYYDASPGGNGFDYAYRYPGMNKVLQAAGRVIRTREDKGVVLLLDDRFTASEYTRLLPRHWRHLQYLKNTQALSDALAAFWKQA